MAQRNYACDDAFATYFPGTSLNVTLDAFGAQAFQAQLYLCQLATALALKSTIEEHRSRNIWGLQTWQLGEVWPTYGWGSLEYSSGPGSVLGGRLKPSHYMLTDAFATFFAACGDDGACYARSDDAAAPLAGALLRLSVTRLTDGAITAVSNSPITLPRGANAVAWACFDGRAPAPGCTPWKTLLPALGCAASGVDCALNVALLDSAGETLAANTQFLAVPGHLNASRAVRVAVAVGTEVADGTVPITLTTAGGQGAAPALFVTLFTLANGRFDRNFIALLPAGVTVVRFLPFASGQRDVLADSLRINSLGELLNPPPPPRPPTGTCTTHADSDGTGVGVTAPGSSIADCCKACWADEQCTAAAYTPAASGTCWLKYGGGVVSRPGVSLCTIDLPHKM